jgi:hypothetical protein
MPLPLDEPPLAAVLVVLVVVAAVPPLDPVVVVVVLLLLPHAASPRASAPVVSTARPNGLILTVTSSPFLTDLKGQP